MIEKSLASPQLGSGSFATVHSVPQYSALVFRHNNDENPKELQASNLYVSVNYDGKLKNIPNTRNLAIPYGLLIDRHHGFSSCPSIPHETLIINSPHKKCIQVLPFCSGKPPHAGHAKEADALYGDLYDLNGTNRSSDDDKYALRCLVGHLNDAIRDNPRASLDEMFTHFANGVYTIPAADATRGARTLNPTQLQTFLTRYERFVAAYTASIARIAQLHQATFNEAIHTLCTLHSAHDSAYMDYDHPGNVLIDFEKQQINFIDVQFVKEDLSRKRPADIDEFAQVLFGKNQFCDWKTIAHAHERERLRPHMQTVIDMLQRAIEANGAVWQHEDPQRLDQLADQFQLRLPLRVPLQSV